MTIRSGALALEARLGAVEGARRAAVVCHPHPQYGGDMDSSVVVAVAAELRRQGVATLRFNFRGVGDSEGSYGGGAAEVEDARAAVEHLRRRLPQAAIALGGYSFGAIVALLAGHDRSDVERLFAIALPATRIDPQPLFAATKPKLFVLGEEDPYCPVAALEALVVKLAGDNAIVRLPGADHFLFGFEQRVGEEVARFVAAP